MDGWMDGWIQNVVYQGNGVLLTLKRRQFWHMLHTICINIALDKMNVIKRHTHTYLLQEILRVSSYCTTPSYSQPQWCDGDSLTQSSKISPSNSLSSYCRSLPHQPHASKPPRLFVGHIRQTHSLPPFLSLWNPIKASAWRKTPHNLSLESAGNRITGHRI